MKKKIGILVDNYKVSAYSEVFKRNGRDITLVEDKMRRLTVISFFVDEKDYNFAVLETNEICKTLESEFKARKN